MPNPLQLFAQPLRRRAIDHHPDRFPPQTTDHPETLNDRWLCHIVGQGDLAQPGCSSVSAHLEACQSVSESVIAASASEAIAKPAVTLTELLDKHHAPRVIRLCCV